MDARNESEPGTPVNPTQAERRSDRELAATRVIAGPARHVFEAFRNVELFKRWWLPEAFAPLLQSIELDVRTGGSYRLVFKMEGSEPMAFFGRYLEVTPHSKIVWTNEESGDAGAVSTATFEEHNGHTHVVMLDTFPTKEALDEAIASGSTSGTGEALDRLNEMIAAQS
jgi:uncharacterized protein YndB with AHSA1/START domain